MPTDPEYLRARLLGLVDEKRRDLIKFTIATVLLTPIFAGIAAVIVMASLHYADLPFVDDIGYERGAAVGMLVSLIYLGVVYVIRGKPKWLQHRSDRSSEGVALVAILVLVWLTWVSDLRFATPTLFWVLFALGTLVYLGFLGRTYQARESYYCGWFGGLMDDFTTIQDDLDRAHVALGLAQAIPSAIIDAYGEIFAGGWAWRGLDDREAAALTDTIFAAAAADTERARRILGALPVGSRPRLFKAIRELGFVARGPAIRLTSEGKRFLAEVSGALPASESP